MTLDDVVQYHRTMQANLLQSAQMADFGHKAGCEDAAASAEGWRQLAERHGRMADTVAAARPQ